MNNREKDRTSQRTQHSDAGEVKRPMGEQSREGKSGTGVELGQKIGRAENLDENEGGMMRNKDDRNDSDLRNTNRGSEPNRKSGSEGFGSSSGRRSGSMESDISREEKSPERSGSVGSRDSSESRH
ncbi:MAG: hypothetical protein ABI779_27550 [Acidobacteriota bacterium]